MLLVSLIAPLDLNSYCAGFCKQRYEWGFYKDDRCQCIDSYPINTANKIDIPKDLKSGSIKNYSGSGDPIPYKDADY